MGSRKRGRCDAEGLPARTVRAVAVALFAASLTSCATSPPPLPADPADVAQVLDGTREILPGPLADLALARALAGGRWLTGVVRPDGSYHYEYDPDDVEYVDDEYNEVRHAGTTYSLFQLAGATGDAAVLEAGEAGVGYIDATSVESPEGRIYTYQGENKLGGQALAIVALLERRRVTASESHDALIEGLARFMLALEIPEDPGRYFHFYTDGERLAEPSSEFYPGEALLALTRLAAHFPDGPYRAAAIRAADYLIHRRDGDLIALGSVPQVDHWLTIALSDLYRLVPDDDYATVVRLQAEATMAELWTPEEGYPARIGGSRKYEPIDFTTTGTRGEALVAAWSLAEARGDEEGSARYAEAARRVAQFAMRVQYFGDEVALFPAPELTVGGWPANAGDADIRIDYVQHNLSALLGVWHLTDHGALPEPGASP
ncbi:hypothetical protein BH24CHL8_BH24CHL8_04150 [soil metagenome]